MSIVLLARPSVKGVPLIRRTTALARADASAHARAGEPSSTAATGSMKRSSPVSGSMAATDRNFSRPALSPTAGKR